MVVVLAGGLSAEAVCCAFKGQSLSWMPGFTGAHCISVLSRRAALQGRLSWHYVRVVSTSVEAQPGMVMCRQ